MNIKVDINKTLAIPYNTETEIDTKCSKIESFL